MAIQHSDITEAQLHENKGVSAAPENTIATSDGLGNTVWQDVVNTSLEGIAANGTSGQRVVTDGSGGFAFVPGPVYGEMEFDSNTSSFSVTAAEDSSLDDHADFVLFTGIGAPFFGGPSSGVVFSTDRITVPIDGNYQIQVWGNLRDFPSTSSKISWRVRLNGSSSYDWHPIAKSNSVGDTDSSYGSRIEPLSAGDYLQIMVASTVTGTVVFHDFSLSVVLLEAT